MTWWWVALGGALGACLRYLIDTGVQARLGSALPFGTLTVNLLGSLALGALTGAVLAGAAGDTLALALGTGLCGALTTYSTFSWETLRLWESGARGPAVLNAVGSVVAAVGAAALGLAVASALWG
ncbi:fluoride efflux transporter CrcB [Streptomyces alkaliphilus]|uniref:Fluoride-specific ion channel FluC n=1 Tax=Streptomyces alkaliphilus TaxID=1472722 RepID=A0A7W3TF85_9ACTN|nr:fluoride efflux transporter CrcB [Streptomyces alkaliphilus]MBB0245722.1 fluoride efflux transporter CrcB [Streptomyces alkaliphilus]